MPQEAVDNANEIDLIELIGIVWSGKWRILLAIVLCVALAGYWVFQQKPVYQSEVLLAPAQQDGGSSLGSQFGGLAALAGINIGSSGENNIEEGLAILKSRHFLMGFIHENNLTKVLFANEWDAESQQWRDQRIWYTDEVVSLQPTQSDIVDRFSKLININQDKNTGLTTLKVEWYDPALASEWANRLVKKLNDYMKVVATEQSNKSLQYLEGELKKTSVLEVRQAIFQIMEGHIKNKTIANVGSEYLFRVIDPAVSADEPSKPNKKLIILIAVILGLLLGCIAIFLPRLARSVRDNRSRNVVNSNPDLT